MINTVLFSYRLRIGLIVFLTAFTWAIGSYAKQASPVKPNIIVIFTDDQVFRALHCAGNKIIHTPNLDRLAERGTRFTTAFVPTPVCVASRASIMSSLYPQQHGSTFLDNQPFIKKVRSGELKILPQYLAEAGYVTGYCGKTHMGDPQENLAFQEGKEHRFDGDDTKTFRFAEEFLSAKAKQDRPFLLWISPHQPHIALKPPEKWRDFYKPEDMILDPNFREQPFNSSLTNQGKPGEITYRDGGGPNTRQEAQKVTALYYGEVSHMDEQVGSLLKKLADLGLQKNTLVIFLSDNGYHLGNHGVGNKLLMYEESVRVPFIVSYPGVIKPGQVSDELVSSLDVMPTILDFAGLPIPKGLEGKSLKPLLINKLHKQYFLRKEVFSECCGVSGLGIGHRMVRTRQWKYMLSDVKEEGLFDLKRDPYELNNLVNNPAAQKQLQQLRKSLARWMDRIGDRHARPPGE
ncbi:MAG: sulfatase family protein [Planctomycetota bacterium]|jgi:arylsulfatase A-like enzyme